MKSPSGKLKWLLLSLVLIVAILTRVYKIDNSITEWFSWRQSDTAAVGRFLERHHFNLLKPQYYDLSNIQSGTDNPQGWRMVEFPLYNSIFALLHQLMPIFSLEVWARLVAICFSLVVLVCLFWFLEAEFGLIEAFFGSLFFAINPFVVFYSRTILPDMPATALAFLSTFLLFRYLKGSCWWLILASLSMALALLIKPTVIFFLIPGLYLLLKKPQTNLLKVVKMIFFILISVLPVYWWRKYIQQFPEGIPQSQWLLTSVNTQTGLQSIFFRPAFFRWIFFERLSQLIMGGYLVFFLLFGFVYENKKNLHLPFVFALTALFYLFTFQGGNVQHEYYQIIILPALAMLIGLGVGNYLKLKKSGYVVVRVLIILAIFGASTLFTFYQVKNKYDVQPNLVLIADVIRSLTLPKDLIVTDSQGDTTLLYLSDRRGYPAPYRELPVLKEQGASYFVTQNLDYKEKLASTSALLFENDQVLIFKL